MIIKRNGPLEKKVGPNQLFSKGNEYLGVMPFKRTISVSVLMILAAVCTRYVSHVENIHMINPLSSFPKRIGEWVGKEEHFDQEIYDILGVDDSLLCRYRGSRGQQVQLYVGFYGNQREGNLIHSPKHCMPGSGWNIIVTSLEELIVPNANPSKITVTKLILEKGAQRQIVLYWFQSRGRFIASEYMQKIYLVIDSVAKQRTDGCFLRLIAPVLDGDEERALRGLKDFAKVIIPILQGYIPS